MLEAASTTEAAPFESVSVKSTCAPANATYPFPSPMFFINVTVNVCAAPTRFVASGVIAIFASTNVFTAGPEFGATPFVETVNADGVPSVPVQVALPVTFPAELDVNTIVHLPLPSVFAPASSHVLAAAFSTATAPFEGVNEKSTCAPEKATKPAPSPRSFDNVTVNVCGAPIRFVASGVIAIFASTNVFTAGPEFGATPSVETVNGVGVPNVPVQLAFPVTFPVAVRREHDRALAVAVRVRTRVVTRARRCVQHRAGTVRVRQREVHVRTR